MAPRPLITAEQRRARLGVRHRLAAEHRAADVATVCRSLVCFHATEAASVHVAAYARGEVGHADVEAALYVDRSVVKQLAMRRTLFGFPAELLPAVWGSAAARVADQQRRQLARELAKSGIVTDEAAGTAWVDAASTAVLEQLRSGGPATTVQLRRQLAVLELRIPPPPGAAWVVEQPVAPRVLTAVAATGRVIRGENAGQWRLNKPLWTPAEDWLDPVPAPLSSAEGYRELVRAWLASFGPGTESDLVWWLGSTKAAVRAALAELDVVEVDLEGLDAVGYLLPDDLDPVDPPEPWAALLPALDPTLMGWREREHYLDPAYVPELFDTNGNGGQTAWWNGRVVGGWYQDPTGVVHLVPLVDLPRAATRALAHEADRLTALLAGDTVNSIYASPLVRRHVAASASAP